MPLNWEMNQGLHCDSQKYSKSKSKTYLRPLGRSSHFTLAVIVSYFDFELQTLNDIRIAFQERLNPIRFGFWWFHLRIHTNRSLLNAKLPLEVSSTSLSSIVMLCQRFKLKKNANLLCASQVFGWIEHMNLTKANQSWWENSIAKL